MSGLLARIKAAHEGRAMVAVPVPEYDCTLYFPPLTLADHEAIRRGMGNAAEHVLLIRGLIRMAHNADGTKAFEDTPETKAELHRMELSVMQRIMAQAGGDLPAEDAAALARADLDAMRQALTAHFGEAEPALAASIAEAPEAALAAALRALAGYGESDKPAKNG